jgi:hypothetical protein
VFRNVAWLVLIGTIVLSGPAPARADEGHRPVREVVGGDMAADGQFPWMVRLSMGCGGTLIAPRVVLTAGHCVDGTGPDTGIEVTAGVVDLKSPDAITARSIAVIRAPGFRTETRGDDWAVVALDRTIDRPTIELTRGGAGDRGTFVVMGWGLIREGPDARSAGCGTRPCRPFSMRTVPPTTTGPASPSSPRTRSAPVATASTPARGTPGARWCGATIPAAGCRWGIVSWGLGCARDGYPGVYTQVSTFRAAIKAAPARSRKCVGRGVRGPGTLDGVSYTDEQARAAGKFGTDAFYAALGRAFVTMCALIPLLFFIEAIDQSLGAGTLDVAGRDHSAPHRRTRRCAVQPVPARRMGSPVRNAVPLILLGTFALAGGGRRFVWSTALIMAVSGLGVWLIGNPSSVVVGASGIIFGYLGLLVTRAFVEHSWWNLGVAAFVGLLYWYQLANVLPTDQPISWQGHLLGLLGGAVAAVLFRRAPLKP